MPAENNVFYLWGARQNFRLSLARVANVTCVWQLLVFPTCQVMTKIH